MQSVSPTNLERFQLVFQDDFDCFLDRTLTINNVSRSQLLREKKQALRELQLKGKTKPKQVVAEKAVFSFLPLKIDFIKWKPTTAPFIPKIFVHLFNRIEHLESNHKDLLTKVDFKMVMSDTNKGICENIYRALMRHNDETLQTLVKQLPYPDALIFTSELLRNSQPKLLYIDHDTIQQLCEKPFYDRFLRVNASLKNILHKVIMRASRTCQDTLAFILYHIMHIREKAKNPTWYKLKLANFYGPMLFQLAEQIHVGGQLTVEKMDAHSAIMEVLVDLFDTQFWDTLTQQKVRAAFRLPRSFGLRDPQPKVLIVPDKTENVNLFKLYFGKDRL